MKAIIAFLMISASCVCMADNTNKVDKTDKPDKVEKEKKTEHQDNKIIVKSRDKGSQNKSDWKTEREIPLMFKNNRKGRPKK
jgi:large-conductance mechanosensitive channel